MQPARRRPHAARRSLLLALALAAWLGVAVPAAAQTSGATVTGLMLDAATGKPLAYGNVVVLGTQFGGMSLDDGTFVVTQIPPGTYTIRASYMGYKTAERTLVRLRNGTVLELEFRLDPTVIQSETVTVLGEKPLVDVTEASSTKSLAADEIAKMPVETVEEVVITQPGVVKQDDEIFIRGGRADETLVLVDGVPMKDALAGTSSAKGIDSKSVAQMDLITGGWRAEYGDAMSGVINVTLKEGGETFTGFAEYGVDHLPGVETTVEHYFTDTYKFQFGGPLPGSGTWFPGERVSFFTNFSGEIMNTRFPSIRSLPLGPESIEMRYEDSFLGIPIVWKSEQIAPRQTNAWNFMGKLAWKLNRDHKLSLTMTKYLSFDQGFSRHDISDLTRQSNSYPYRWSQYLNHYSAYVEDRNTAVLKYRQNLSGATFHELQVSRFFVRIRQDSQREYAENLVDYLAQYEPQALDWPDPAQGDDWTFHPYFYLNGEYNQYRDRFVERYALKWDITKKWYPHHKGKAGFTVGYESIQNIEIRDPWIQRDDGLGRKDIFQAFPTTGTLYAQDDVEYRDFVANLGMRMDFWFPGKLAENAAQAAIDGEAGDLFTAAVGEEFFTTTNAFFGNRYKYTISPRVAISYPVTDRDNLFFNYGHFSQWPTYYYVYTHVASGVEDLFGNLGNINLDPQITIQYELGARHTFRPGLAGDITVFVKDIFNYPTSERFTVQYFDPVEGSKEATYFLYRNSDYARSRGIELSLRKRRGKYLSGGLNYTYSIATGRSSDPNAQRELFIGGATGEVELAEGFLWWNRPHRLSANFDFRVSEHKGPTVLGVPLPGHWGFNCYYNLSSGRAYTPEDLSGRPIDEDYSRNGPLEMNFNLKLQKWVIWGNHRIDFTLQGWNVFGWDEPRAVDPVTGKPYEEGKGSYANALDDPDSRLARTLGLLDPQPPRQPAALQVQRGGELLMARRALAFAVAALLLAAAAPAGARELGGLRVATSSGTFLKIGIGPRGAAMGGAWTAIAADATAAWYNPAGLGQPPNRQVFLGYVAWPADIRYGNFIVAAPSPLMRGTAALQFGSLSTTMEETDEYHPYGTGRSFAYTDWVLGLSFARPMTDQLLLGLTAKFVREDLGSAVGGPTTNTWTFDVGTLYSMGYANLRIGMAIQNFGPEFKPSGEYWNHVEQKAEGYEGFPPPSTFKLGMAYEPWKSYPWILTQTLEMNHLADNQETLATGIELSYMGGLLAFRGGYDFMSDEMGLSGGFGALFMAGSSIMGLDYAYTDGNSLGAIHRWALRVDF